MLYANLYKVAIIGRVNVGKSTLYNRLIQQKKAIVSSVAGTTRDRNYAVCSWRDLDFYLIDTGGMERQNDDEIDKQIIEQALMAITEADLILFTVDTKTGIMPADSELAKKIKRQKTPVIVVANKADNQRLRNSVAEFYKLGLGEPIPASASTGVGTGDLLDKVVEKLKKIKNKKTKSSEQEADIKVAIIGKPNVGKSSMVNAILGQERVITSALPHTTRDSQDIQFKYNDKIISFIDTAGLRRRSKVSVDPFEKQSIEQSLESLKNADIALLVTDVSKKLSFQDKHIIDEVKRFGTGLIILANKWDLIPEKDTASANEYISYYKYFFPFVSWAPVIFCSAKKKIKISKILDSVLEVHQEKAKIISENALSKLLKGTIKKHKPSRGRGTKHPYIYTLKQTSSNPPEFLLKIEYKSSLHESYLRFVENNIRYKFGFSGVPIKIRVAKSQNQQDK
ncbi:MAG: ribosome biogenesis GTPase Der [bacterium]|nr:ribosome biogenesis GTPase Der [bacterium]